MEKQQYLDRYVKDPTLVKYDEFEIGHTILGQPIVNINFTLKNNTKLADVFKKLPFGIINKTVTGIGGTTLELKARRNSIIVEPLRAIAASKALLNKEKYRYIGSAFGQFKDRYTTAQNIAYLRNDNILHKKFLVVADSLPDLIKLLELELGPDLYQKYFLAIDEIDSFQGDSGFRESMELCMDIYKKFGYENRCLISATLMEFSDPELSDESTTKYQYEDNETRQIDLIYSKTLPYVAAELIHKLITDKPNEKIFIACSSLDLIKVIINDLVKELNIDPQNISIMCSPSNKLTARPYYKDFENNLLPNKITFMTSAYFTGIDINEKYHSISLATQDIPHTLLSNQKLNQIKGRGRLGLLSETMIYYCNETTVLSETHTVESLKSMAETNLSAAKCYERQFLSNPYLKHSLDKLKESLVNLSDQKGYKLIRKNILNQHAISWFNIDGFLEIQRIKNTLYNNPQSLFDSLKKDEQVHFKKVETKRNVNIDRDYRDEDKELLISEALDELGGIKSIEELFNLKQVVETAAVKQKVYDIYEKLIKYLPPDESLKRTEEFSLGHDLREFHYYMQSLAFEFTPDAFPFKAAMLSYFKPTLKITRDVMCKKMIEIFEQFQMDKNLISTYTAAVKILKCYFQINSRNGIITIKGYDPKDLARHKIEQSDNGELETELIRVPNVTRK